MTSSTTCTLIAGLLLAGLSATAQARDFDAARFAETKCTGCHDSSVYTRSNRRVRSLPALETQVRMCDANIGTKLFNEDMTALVHYLNDKYYKFK